MHSLKYSKKLLCFLIFPIVMGGMIGCSYDRKYYGFQPSLYDRGLLRSLDKGTDTPHIETIHGMKVEYTKDYINIKNFRISIPRESIKSIKITDADILGFTDDVKKILQSRSNLARRFRLTSGTGQILTAAAGATLGFIANANVETIAALAAVGAVIPELQTIWEARGRAAIYNKGLDMIQKAEERYYEKIAKSSKGSVSAVELTPDGAELLKEVTACIQVIGTVLVDLIPTVEELQAATGRVKDELEQIKVAPESAEIMYLGTQTVQVLYGKAIAYSIDGVNIIEIVPTKFENAVDKFDIRGVGSGTAKVTIFNSHGKSKNINVKVVRKIPVADAGGNRTVSVGFPVTLNGWGEAPDRSEPDKYEWKIIPPEGSKPVFTGTLTATPEFVPDKIGAYTVTLRVTAKGEFSDPSKVTITAKNEKPTAKAKADKTDVAVGDTVSLDGSESFDPDKHELTYKWEFKKPDGSSSNITGTKTATFKADVAGEYVVALIVNDGHTDSDPDEVTINAQSQNTKPTANAGEGKTVKVGETVELDGSKSSDPEGDTLVYKWDITEKPVDSSAKIEKQETQTSFTPDKTGKYVVKLIVNDKQEDSDPSEVTINAEQ